MCAGETIGCERVVEQGSSGAGYVVSDKHFARLFLGTAGFAYLQRVVIAAASHVFTADPSVNQRFQRFHLLTVGFTIAAIKDECAAR